ncbi:hypothetical protein O3Q52_19990 [Streptomyces sp. ActVer]|uniref:hypothetical protein n=1 Tax=Streptomyces sp. ActVer TaxID=3014558 RepID=UPI0022B407E3|nr:hypothetical protein [Streptomyces sp. ActVer]MCZ4510428.1 hypothetical protein [Streptomyces sp. ActVer]
MPTDDELAKFIADCNQRRHGRRSWQEAVQAAARRFLGGSDDDRFGDEIDHRTA